MQGRHSDLRCTVCVRRESGGGFKLLLTGRERSIVPRNGGDKVTREILCGVCGHVGWTNRRWDLLRIGAMAASSDDVRRLSRIYATVETTLPRVKDAWGRPGPKLVPEAFRALVDLTEKRGQEGVE